MSAQNLGRTCRVLWQPRPPRMLRGPEQDSSASVLLNLGLAILHCGAPCITGGGPQPLWPPQACSIAQPPVITRTLPDDPGEPGPPCPSFPVPEHPALAVPLVS